MSYETVELFFVENNYSNNTEDIYSRMITDAIDDLGDLSTLSPTQFRSWLYNHDTWGESTTWLSYCAVRAFLKWRYGKDHPALNLSIKREDAGPQRTLSIDQAKTVYIHLKNLHSDIGTRDLAIFSLLLDTGLRSSEICRLDRGNLNLDTRTLTVKVKGGDWGSAIYSEVTTRHLIEWLHKRHEHVGSTSAVFVGIKGTKPGTRITNSGLRVIVRRWGKRSGIGPLSPHDFRRTFATISTILQAPTRLVQMAGRWSRLEEVERYTRGLQLLEFDQYLPMRKVSQR